MNIRPVKNSKTPCYPTLTSDETTLHLQSLPERWKRNSVVAAALTAMLLLAEQTPSDTPEAAATAIECTDAPHLPVYDVKRTAEKPRHMVSPIFKHGKGRGVTGCIVIAPPSFISEDEARIIIREELARSGIIIDRQDVEASNGLLFDGVSDPAQIAFVYASRDDVRRMAWKHPGGSSVSLIDALKCAKILHRRFSHEKEYLTAVFYDPMEALQIPKDNTDESYREAYSRLFNMEIDNSHERAITQLRWQVQDFIGWLVLNNYLSVQQSPPEKDGNTAEPRQQDR